MEEFMSDVSQGSWAENPRNIMNSEQVEESVWDQGPAKAEEDSKGNMVAQQAQTVEGLSPEQRERGEARQAVAPALQPQTGTPTSRQADMPGLQAQATILPPEASGPRPKAQTRETDKLKANFGFFGPAAFLYAVFYAFCMYKNGSGVTFPFFVAGGLLFLRCSLSKLEITLKRGSVFYMAAIMLLAISTFLTDDGRLIFFNKLGILLLMMSLLLSQFCNTEKWKLGKFLSSICQLIVMSIGELGRPFHDGKAYRAAHKRKNYKNVFWVIIGLMIAVPLFLVVLLLLASADAIFREMTEKLLYVDFHFGDIMNIVFRIVFLFFASYTLLSYLCRKCIREEVKDRRSGEPVLAITVTSLLTLLYLFFSGIQIAALFLGKLQLPEGYTYAQYAREGFFQLLAVSVLNLIIVLVCLGFFRESRPLKGILALMSLCTYVMIASSAMRMVLYIMYYDLTFLRILVLWGLALLAVLFVGVCVNIFKEDFPLFRYSVAVVAILYLALSFAHPDYLIAKVNVDNGTEDYSYLSRLSADAAPVLTPYMEKLNYDLAVFKENEPLKYMKNTSEEEIYSFDIDGFGYYWMNRMKKRTENFNVRTFNVSRFIMLRMLDESM